VIGQELAEAQAAEHRRKQKGALSQSPVPDGMYDFWRGEQSLINPNQNSLDLALVELCKRFAESDAESRADMRAAISMDEFYTLLTFSHRAAVFAIRERDADWVVSGLTAIAMIEQERTDYRDVLLALSLIYHSASRIGEDPDRLLQDAAALSGPGSDLILGFSNRTPEDKDLRNSWGHDEVQTSDGTGFIGWGFEHYDPTYDLKKIVMEIAELITTDKYQPSSIQVATSLPSIWLESKKNKTPKALRAIRAGGSISAKLRPNQHPNHDSQMLVIFVVEAQDEATAEELLLMSRKKKASDYSMAGVAEGRLFCLVVARSFVQGVESFETIDSVARFLPGIGRILRQKVSRI